MGPLLVLVCPCFYRGNVIITCKIVWGGGGCGGVCRGVCVCVCLTYLPRTFIWQHHEWHRGLYTFQGPKHTRVLAKHWLKTPKTSCFTILGDQRSEDLKGLQKLLYIWGHSSPRKYKQNQGVCMCQWGGGVFVCVCVFSLCVGGVGCALGCVGCVIKQYYPIFPLFQILICSNIIINAMGLDPTFGNLCGKHPPTNWVPPPEMPEKCTNFSTNLKQTHV